MTKDEALKLALEALEESVDLVRHEYSSDWRHGLPTRKAQLEGMKAGLDAHEAAITALRDALGQPEQPSFVEWTSDYVRDNLHKLKPEQEQWDATPDAFNEWWNADYDDTGNPYRKDSPAYWAWSGWKAASKQPEQEFIKHHGDDEGWSEWVCPDPDDYLISCCDCGLVHQAQFRVAKYESAPSEECEIVNDPDLQAQFRMRRHATTKPQPDNWTPEDTAHRVGGLAQPDREIDWKDQYEKQKRRAEMWRDKYEAVAGPDECVGPAQQPEERNFCPRCGKRTVDLTTIHTCTPPKENT